MPQLQELMTIQNIGHQGAQSYSHDLIPKLSRRKNLRGYKNSIYKKSIEDGVIVKRIITYISANEGVFKRTIDYISFMLSSILFGIFNKKS